jgi:hypothetical protein
MTVRVLRLLEYVYPDLETAQIDMERWHVPPTGSRSHKSYGTERFETAGVTITSCTMMPRTQLHTSQLETLEQIMTKKAQEDLDKPTPSSAVKWYHMHEHHGLGKEPVKHYHSTVNHHPPDDHHETVRTGTFEEVKAAAVAAEAKDILDPSRQPRYCSASADNGRQINMCGHTLNRDGTCPHAQRHLRVEGKAAATAQEEND